MADVLKIEEDNTNEEKDKKKEYIVSELCVACIMLTPQVIFLPCLHACCCFKCAAGWLSRTPECPLCRKNVVKVDSLELGEGDDVNNNDEKEKAEMINLFLKKPKKEQIRNVGYNRIENVQRWDRLGDVLFAPFPAVGDVLFAPFPADGAGLHGDRPDGLFIMLLKILCQFGGYLLAGCIFFLFFAGGFPTVPEAAIDDLSKSWAMNGISNFLSDSSGYILWGTEIFFGCVGCVLVYTVISAIVGIVEKIIRCLRIFELFCFIAMIAFALMVLAIVLLRWLDRRLFGENEIK